MANLPCRENIFACLNRTDAESAAISLVSDQDSGASTGSILNTVGTMLPYPRRASTGSTCAARRDGK
jgi:hypothetical protein